MPHLDPSSAVTIRRALAIIIAASIALWFIIYTIYMLWRFL